jgi:tetratricopeptide (TPR) repeat protein
MTFDASMSKRSLSRVLAIPLLTSLLLAAAPPSARAETPPSATRDVALAEQHAAEAFEAYKRGDHARAVVLYHNALTAAPSADILYNIARVYDLGLGNRQQAIDYYERYTTQPDAVPSRLEAARQRLIELHATEDANTAAPGMDAIAREFPLDAPDLPAPNAAPSHDGDRLGPLTVAAIAVGTAGLVGVGVGVGFGLSARSESEAWKSDCDGNACTSQRGVDAAEAANRRATIATLGFGIGGGLLALAAVLWIVDGSGDDDSDDSASLDFIPRASGSELGGAIGGRF